MNRANESLVLPVFDVHVAASIIQQHKLCKEKLKNKYKKSKSESGSKG